MSLKVVKGASVKPQNKKGLWIIGVISQQGKLGYLCEIDGEIKVSDMIIPQVSKFDDYDQAREKAGTLKGCSTRIIGEQTIEKTLEKQGIKPHEIIPIGSQDKTIFHVVVHDGNTKEDIGYVSMNNDKKYIMVATTEGAAFWDSESSVDIFIQQAIGNMVSGLTLKKKKFN